MRISPGNNNSNVGAGPQQGGVVVTLEKMGTGIRASPRKSVNGHSSLGTPPPLPKEDDELQEDHHPPPPPRAVPSSAPSEWTEAEGRGVRSSVPEGGLSAGPSLVTVGGGGGGGHNNGDNHSISPMRQRRMLQQHQYLERACAGVSQGTREKRGSPRGVEGAWGSAEDYKPKKASNHPNHPRVRKPQPDRQRSEASPPLGSLLPRLQHGLSHPSMQSLPPAGGEVKDGEDPHYNEDEDYPSPPPSSLPTAAVPPQHHPAHHIKYFLSPVVMSQPPWPIPPFQVSPGATLGSDSSPGGSPGGFFPPVVSSPNSAAAGKGQALDGGESTASTLYSTVGSKAKAAAVAARSSLSRASPSAKQGSVGVGKGGLMGSLETLSRIYPPDHSVWKLLTSSSDKFGLGGGGGGGGSQAGGERGRRALHTKSRVSHSRNRTQMRPELANSPIVTHVPDDSMEEEGEGGEEAEAVAYQAALEAVTRDDAYDNEGGANGGEEEEEEDPGYRLNLSDVITDNATATEGRSGPPLKAFPTKKHRMAAALGEDAAVYSYY